MTLPPSIPDKDDANLRLLAIFHRIYAGVGLFCGMSFIGVHFAFMHTLMHMPVKEGQEAPPPELETIMHVMYVFMALMIAVGAAVNLLSAHYIFRRKNRIFSLVIAGLNCLQMPFGLILGIFTFVLLLKASVDEKYKANAPV